MGRSSWNKEQLQEAVKNNTSISGTLRYMGFPSAGSCYNWIKKKIKKYNLDTSHFTNKPAKRVSSITDEKFFTEGVHRTGNSLRRRLIKNGLPYVCCGCDIQKWETKVATSHNIVLQVDHINGDSLDNRVENLRFLCPNCHSMTETFCGKNVKRAITMYICDFCGVEIDRGKRKCVDCKDIRSDKHDEKEWPDDESFKTLLRDFSIKVLPQKINCDIRSIRTHCKKLGITDLFTWKLEENRKRKKGFNLKLRQSSCPPKEVLQDLIWKHPTTYIAKQYSCSDKAVEKWCKKYNISKPPRGYWAKQYSISGRQKDVGESV